MCEFSDWFHKNKAFQDFRAGVIHSALLAAVNARFPHALKEGCCPKCGNYLQDWERRPAGRATRSMCREHYEHWIAGRVDANCFVCGMPLENNKIQAQYQNPREVEHHIHEGDCKTVWTVLHNVALGEPDMVRAFGRQMSPQPRGALEQGFGNGDFIEAEFTQAPTLDWEPAPKALHAPGQRIPQFVQRTHKGKPVRTVA
jgi:hypothetical protein